MLVLRALWRGFEIISTVLERFWQSAAVIFLVGMWGLLLLNAISRWMEIDATGGWPLELVGYMLAWTIFVMLGPAAKWDKHIKVPYFSARLLGEKRGAVFTHVLESAAGLSFSIFFSISAYRWISLTHRNNVEYPSAGGWEYPMWIVRSGIFVGFALLSFFYLHRLLKWIISVAPKLQERGIK